MKNGDEREETVSCKSVPLLLEKVTTGVAPLTWRAVPELQPEEKSGWLAEHLPFSPGHVRAVRPRHFCLSTSQGLCVLKFSSFDEAKFTPC